MPLNTFKLFIASSSELKEDRNEFRTFISLENDRLKNAGIYLEMIQWEHFLDAISNTRLQNEYNEAIRESDIVLCMFFTRAGKYTAEEFDIAHEAFMQKGKPLIWTYFKDAPIQVGAITEEFSNLLRFKEKLTGLGHYPTVYRNIDNLKYQFRNQLDKALTLLNNPTAPSPKMAETAPFNEKLTRRLIEAIQVYSPRAKKFSENATRMTASWETQPRLSDPAKEIIAFSFVGILGIQLRKLMAIGKEPMSDQKLRKYLENCQLTSKRALQLVCFALLSRFWDYKKDNHYILSSEHETTCTNFFDDVIELDINGYHHLLKTLVEIYIGNGLEFPIQELNGRPLPLGASTEFTRACAQLQAIDGLLETGAFTTAQCKDAEDNVATVLETLNFLANYKMVSIKSIGYSEMRNSKPHYLYTYTALGIDLTSNINQEKINYAEAPINTDAVLLYRESYQQNLNLFPFIIDVNALTCEGGAKICFYACQNNSDGSLRYVFSEDNSEVCIASKKALVPGSDINELLMDPEKRKAMNFTAVYTLFQEAKKAVTGSMDTDDFLNAY